MAQLLFLNPIFKESIWGGDQLNTRFGYSIPSDHTGECWAVSAHKHGDCTIRGGEFDGQTLSRLWDSHRELFGGLPMKEFPLLIKIIDARDDLSIQVHPDDAYAYANEHGALGKTECWYVLDCDQDATIIIGHNAKTKDELGQMVEEKRWQDLISPRPLHKGDFFQILPGTVHAIRKGSLILEVQQSSDITYRLYDYDRLQDGAPRSLHIEQSLDNIRTPYEEVHTERTKKSGVGYEWELLVECPYYHVEKVTVSGRTALNQKGPFSIVSVLSGHGTIDGEAVHKGDHFILTAGYGSFCAEGQLQMVFTYVPYSKEREAQQGPLNAILGGNNGDN